MLPVKMDDGMTIVFHGFRVQYNDARFLQENGFLFLPLWYTLSDQARCGQNGICNEAVTGLQPTCLP